MVTVWRLEIPVRRQVARRLAQDAVHRRGHRDRRGREHRSRSRRADDGVTWTGDFPKSNYEIRFEGRRVRGGDFFASLTFPVGDSYCTFVTGGWGGDIIGLSSIDGWDASDNETRAYFNFDTGRWYAFRLRVTPDRITAWIDDQQVINVVITGRTIDLRPGPTKLCVPLGFMSYNTAGSVRKIEFRK